MIEALPIQALRVLDRSAIHLFVAGPGVGEGIAVALPDRGWVMVDCCKVSGTTSVPLVDIYDQLRSGNDDRVELAVLTHPHDDHTGGFPTLLERTNPGRIGVVGRPPHESLHLEAQARHSTRPEDAAEEQRQGRFVQALNAIRAWEAGERSIDPFVEGTTMSLGDTTISCCAPTHTGVASFFDDIDDARLLARLRRRANELSIVIEIRHGSTSIVLGGDLPTTSSDAQRRSIPTGWNHVMVGHPHLGAHHALKIPHHGSAHAHHSELMKRASHRRRWICTPFNGMPAFGDTGVGALLENEAAVHMTARPTAWPIVLDTRRVASYGSRPPEARPASDPFVAVASPKRPRPHDAPTAHVWAFEFDAQGSPGRMWAGDGAFTLVP